MVSTLRIKKKLWYEKLCRNPDLRVVMTNCVCNAKIVNECLGIIDLLGNFNSVTLVWVLEREGYMKVVCRHDTQILCLISS